MEYGYRPLQRQRAAEIVKTASHTKLGICTRRSRSSVCQLVRKYMQRAERRHGTLIYRPCSAPLAATIQQAGDTRMSNGSAVAICYVLCAISLLDNADTNLLPASSHKQHKLLNRHLVQRRLFRVKRLMHHNASPPSENDSFS